MEQTPCSSYYKSVLRMFKDTVCASEFIEEGDL